MSLLLLPVEKSASPCFDYLKGLKAMPSLVALAPVEVLVPTALVEEVALQEARLRAQRDLCAGLPQRSLCLRWSLRSLC